MKQEIKKTTEHKEEIVSLTEKLFNEFSIQELEKRYETDPLLLNNLFQIGFAENGDETMTRGCSCKKIGSCPTLTCGCDAGVVSPPPLCPELQCPIQVTCPAQR